MFNLPPILAPLFGYITMGIMAFFTAIALAYYVDNRERIALKSEHKLNSIIISMVVIGTMLILCGLIWGTIVLINWKE